MNYSYANKVLKAELQDFLDGLCKDAKRPVAKLFFDLVYGLMRSGSSLVSLIVRSSCPGEKPGTAEHRITQAIAPSLTGTGLVLIGATTPLLLPVPKKRLLYLGLSLALLGASIGLSFLPTPYPRYVTVGLFIAFLVLAWRKEKKGNACKSLLLSSLGLTTLFFLGAIPTNGNDDIASLTWKGIFHQDNHLYAVSLFFSLFLLLGLLGLGLTMSLYRFLDKRKQARSVSE